jgi:calcineurin-like phosphoesterase family protein
MDWFIADTHYHHKNIIRGLSDWPEGSGQRAFDDFDSHDKWLVDMINDQVQYEDVLHHIGDWSFGGKDQILAFRNRLNVGTVHLILGNHDHHIQKHMESAYLRYGFASVSHYKELTIGDRNLVLMHYPIASWNNMDRGAIHLHGHVHGKIEPMLGRYDVGVDALGLVSMDDVRHMRVAEAKRHGREVGGNKFGT